MSKSLRPPRAGRRVGARPGRKSLPFVALLVEPVRLHSCFNCSGFASVQVRIDGVLHTVTCPACDGRSGSVVVAR
ncbi:hypothetical protein [Kitasatospora sp. KL5]|uniref:hypothetical protein n=1 Tax=Kitasatospora sp. KL5 TaxID=3425125 RepID=UPI003D6FDB26